MQSESIHPNQNSFVVVCVRSVCVNVFTFALHLCLLLNLYLYLYLYLLSTCALSFVSAV